MNWEILRNLVQADGRRVARDAFLGWMAVTPLAMALALRSLADPIRGAVGSAEGADRWLSIVDGAFFAIVLPLVMGAVLGFMLLDEKDSHTLAAIRATPVSLSAYLAWRIIVIGLFNVVAVLVTHPIAGLTSPGGLGIFLVALAGAPLAGSSGVGLAAAAANKVQGFALVKLALVVLLLPCVGVALSGVWLWATVWLPSWWPLMVYTSGTQEGLVWALLAGDYVINILIIAGALRRLAATG